MHPRLIVGGVVVFLLLAVLPLADAAGVELAGHPLVSLLLVAVGVVALAPVFRGVSLVSRRTGGKLPPPPTSPPPEGPTRRDPR